MYRLLSTIIIAIAACHSAGAVVPERRDSLYVVPALPDTSVAAALRPEMTAPLPAPPLQRLDSRYIEDMHMRAVAPLFRPHSFTPVAPGTARTDGSEFYGLSAAGSSVSLPGLAAIATGALSAHATFGQLTITADAHAQKFGYFGGLQTIYGFGGSISYRFSPRWSLTAFGNYYTAATPVNPAIGGMMGMTTVGGYLSYEINDRWGVSVGAQSTRSIFDGRWHHQPIVTPYYKINDKVSVGANVGGIVSGLLQNYINARNARRSGPPPPRR